MAWLWRQVMLSSILLLHLISGVISNEEGDVLTSFRSNMEDPNNVLKDWDSSLVSPCTWAHITCTNDNVTKIDLGNSALSGTLTSQIGMLKNLQILELYNNNIGGIIPDEIGNLSNLVSLDLYSNNFSGQIPETLGKLKKLLFLRINNNKLDGPIPRSLTSISELQFLNLSNNNLSGEVPTTGPFSRFTRTSFANNPLLCGPATMVQCPGAPPFSPPPQLIPPSTFSSSRKSASKTGTIIGGVAASIALFFVAPAIGIVWWHRRKKEECFFDIPAEDEAEVQLGQMKIYSFGELQVATDDFSDKNILGKGGFGIVYEGRLADGSLVAVKKLKERGTSNEKLQFQIEVEMFSRAVHRNLLRLRGYCMTSKELLLVYPYMANGSVASCLKECLPSKSPLDWATRKRIALGSARGLSYMHDHCDPKIIHRDVKAANILLDEEFEAVVGDFGLARLMDYNDTHVFTDVRGTVGHIPPEYLLTHKFSEKTDVYGYGVMLLELITAQRGSDLAHNALENGFALADWVNTQLEEKRLNRIVDPNLEANYIDIEVEELIQVALLCIERSPEERPKMSEVVRMLEGSGLAERWERRQKVKFVQEEEFYSQYLREQIKDSTYILSAEKLSGPR